MTSSPWDFLQSELGVVGIAFFGVERSRLLGMGGCPFGFVGEAGGFGTLMPQRLVGRWDGDTWMELTLDVLGVVTP